MIQTKDAQNQIARSRQTLATWQLMAGLSHRPGEVLRLLQLEIHTLEALALDHPRNAPAAAQLIAAYDNLADSLNRSIARRRTGGSRQKVA